MSVQSIQHVSDAPMLRLSLPFSLVALLASAGFTGYAAEPPLSVLSVLVDEQALAGAHDVQVVDKLAFVAGKAGSLAIVDVQDPARPQVVSSLRHGEQLADAETVLPAGDRLYLGTRDFLWLDVRNVQQPVIKGLLIDRPRIDRINGMVRRGNVAMVDLSNPMRPEIVAKLTFDDPRGPNGLAISGKIAFAAGGQTISVINLSQPTRPVVLDSRKYLDIFRDSAGEDDAHDLVYLDGHLYVTGQTTHSLGILRASEDLRRLAAP